MARTGRPVYSVERDPRLYGFARARLRRWRNVTIVRGDSREALSGFFSGPLRTCKDRAQLFYLDAHWNEDLPLAEELDLVFSNSPAAVVMVDDFQVPDDSDYGYDDYGPGKALTAAYIAKAVTEHSLAIFYPATPGAIEQGKRRGCVVVARADMQGGRLQSLDRLRLDPRQSISAAFPASRIKSQV